METEYRKQYDLAPTVLYREDLVSLIELFDCQSDERKEFELEYQVDESTTTLKNIETLTATDNLPATNAMSLRVLIWKDQEIISGVSFTFHYNFIHYQLHSPDETWFLGTNSKIQRFFKSKRPWYARLNTLAPFYTPLICMTSGFKAVASLKAGEQKDTLFWGLFTIGFVAISLLIFSQKIFPYVRISLDSKENKKITYEKLTFLITVLALVVAIVGIVMQFIKP